jgi:hypothetical protein
MAQSLTAVANGDLTVTLTLTGGTAGQVVDVYAAVLNHGPAADWQPLTVAVLDGTGVWSDTFAAPRGLWVFAGVSMGVPWGMFARVVNAAEDATATLVRKAIRARIELLALPGLMGVFENLSVRDAANLEYPCVVITSEDVAETDEGSMSLTDDVGYPNRLTIADRIDMQDARRLPTFEKWRQTIARAFRHGPLDSPAENFDTRVEYDAIIHPNLPEFEHTVSELTVRAICREPRGLGL